MQGYSVGPHGGKSATISFGTELIGSTIHSTFELCVAATAAVLVDRFILTDLNLSDIHNESLPGVTRAGIAIAWGLVTYGVIQFFG